jgi:hypothetical protein
MRMMSHRITLDSSDGYIIANAEVGWEAMPSPANFEAPAIRVSNEPLDGKIVGNIDDCISKESLGGIDDLDFKIHYIDALHGELDGWKLIGVRINMDDITLLFTCESTYRIEFLHINSAPWLHLRIEAPTYDGSIDAYLVEMSTDVASTTGEQIRFLKVTEYEPKGRREIIFEHGNLFHTECSDSDYRYAYVIEYR